MGQFPSGNLWRDSLDTEMFVAEIRRGEFSHSPFPYPAQAALLLRNPRQKKILFAAKWGLTQIPIKDNETAPSELILGIQGEALNHRQARVGSPEARESCPVHGISHMCGTHDVYLLAKSNARNIVSEATSAQREGEGTFQIDAGFNIFLTSSHNCIPVAY